MERCFDGERRTMTGDASRGATPRGRCIPRGHPISSGPAHHALLGNEVYVVENLKKNLNRLPPFCPFVALPLVALPLVALPLKIRGGSGSLVRAVALLPGR